MFRRRTDQVYSTLQQVQRRITEQTGTSMPPGGPIKAMPPIAIPPSGMSPVSSVPQVPLTASDDPALSPTPASPPVFVPIAESYISAPTAPLPARLAPAPVTMPPAANPTPTMYPPASGSRHYIIQLSAEMAMTIVVMWFLSLAICFYLGMRAGNGSGAGLAAGLAGNREVSESAAQPADKPGALVVLVLDTAPATSSTRSSYGQSAKKWNDWASINPSYGVRPWFGVREPRNGNIELVYGLMGGKFGLPGKDLKLGEFFSRPAPDGPGFGRATWHTVE